MRMGDCTMRLHQRHHHDGTNEEEYNRMRVESSLSLLPRIAKRAPTHGSGIKRHGSRSIFTMRLCFSWSLLLTLSIGIMILYAGIIDLRLNIRRLSMLSDRPRRCPELIEATRFAYNQVMHRHPNTPAIPKVRMIQLVGEWKDQHTKQIIEKVFRHNQRMLAPHGIESVAILHPPATFLDAFADYHDNDITPPFWKMGAIYEQCQQGDIELLWYLDGDALIMDPHARVEFLWLYHSYLNHRQQQQEQQQHLDMLFAHDGFGFNAGIILVNCTSATAMSTLKAWQVAAVQLMTTYKDQAPELDCWYEQKSLHFMLNTWQWNNIPVNQSLYWDDFLQNDRKLGAVIDFDTFSSESLTRRIRHTSSQCALNSPPPPNSDMSMLKNGKNTKSAVTPTTMTSRGQFILHTAGLKGVQKNLVLDHYQQVQSWSRQNLTWSDAAIYYLRNHPFSYKERELVFDGVYNK